MFAPSGRVEYRWALDVEGIPVPITAAVRGGHYTCPLCHSPMIARLGTQVRHHFSHESANECDSESVSWAALRRWMTIRLGEALREGRHLPIKWKCRLCNGQHTANLLDGGVAIHEDEANAPLVPDVLISDRAGKAITAFLIQGAAGLPDGVVQRVPDAYVLRVPVEVALEPPTLDALLRAARLISGPCPVWRAAGPILRGADEIRAAVAAAVSLPPGYIAVAIESIGGLNDMARVGTAKIWATYAHWRQIFAPSVNRLAAEVEVLINQWPLTDGRLVYAYFVRSRETNALAARCVSASVDQVLRLDERFRRRRTTALDIARYLVTH